MYRLSTSVLLLLLIWVATVKAQAIDIQSINISEEEIFDCSMYVGCKHPLETGKATRLREVYELGGPKFQKLSSEMFMELTSTPMPSSEEEFWNKTSREVCAKKTRVEMKNIFIEYTQELAAWWSKWCESNDPSDKIECDACGKGAPHLIQILTEAKAQGKCGETVPTSLPKFG